MRVTAAGLAPEARSDAVACTSPRSAAWCSGVIPSPCARGAEPANSAVTTRVKVTTGTEVFCGMVVNFSLPAKAGTPRLILLLQRDLAGRIAELCNVGQA